MNAHEEGAVHGQTYLKDLALFEKGWDSQEENRARFYRPVSKHTREWLRHE